ncbi:E3 ubiquitin/ISG15 ligase TRIM25-like [Coregonus clupeaformis]|uniref:E3 ubiquitin/ISG15 ligase TRIM25-like n=1 Tax=Coregonus clupeaformis TaxID=59861 RepID=UPI001E1C670F|nr:E3 ubiquitin/ISG15 ligase TRIM25-like [Coregonus clupeaformis]
MASSSSLQSEEQFLCSICLDLFTEPVTTSCGHNFCMACVTKYWDSQDLCQCPLCQEKFSKRPKLRVNTTFKEVVNNFKRMRDRGKDKSPPKPKIVPCDVCTGTKHKALKSCLVCQTSYCETHLEPHQIASPLKRHKLINPVVNLEDRMCKKHGRLLDLFCRTHQTCVCQFCTEADHKTHDTIPIEEECGERKVQLGKTEAEVQLQNVKEIKLLVDLSKRDSREAVSQLEEALNKEMEKLPEVKLKKIQQYAVDLTLDPDTAHPWLILSEDGKQSSSH